ncbi:MAG TPA: NAD-dependent epimerase/dehydratase family protein [Dehalococcoidia bacterium]|nr:NAD-dependent epimerase/dehydratase family protein [Dehalococcoidia bacterium]
MYQTVLITGAGGFIGSHVVEKQLSLGREVRAVDLHLDRISDISHPALRRIQGNFADPAVQQEAIPGAEVVIHLASAHLEVSLPEETYWQVNVHSLAGFLQACRDHGVQRFVQVSSSGVYGAIKEPPADEESPCHPELLYERTKYQGELEVKRFYQETGFPVVIVRPAWVYGPGCPRTGKLFRSIAKNRFFFVGDGMALRHCVYIDDFVDALELAATTERAVGRTYIIGDEAPTTLENLVSEIARITNASVPRFHAPVWLMAAVGLLMEAAFFPLRKEPPISRRTLRFFQGNSAFDISRAKRELGFVPKYDVSTGLRAYAQRSRIGSIGGAK